MDEEAQVELSTLDEERFGVEFEGVLPNLERRFERTASEASCDVRGLNEKGLV